jgi:hypothetical protein
VSKRTAPGTHTGRAIAEPARQTSSAASEIRRGRYAATVYISMAIASSAPTGRTRPGSPSPPATARTSSPATAIPRENAPTGYRRRSASGTNMPTAKSTASGTTMGRGEAARGRLSRATESAVRLSTTSWWPRSQP